MKTTLLILLWLFPSLQAAPTPPSEPQHLFLHFFSPLYDARWSRISPPERIVSVEVYSAQEFDVAVGSSTLSVLLASTSPP